MPVGMAQYSTSARTVTYYETVYVRKMKSDLLPKIFP